MTTSGEGATIFEDGPKECPRCGSPHVVPGHSHGFSGAYYPAWVCDVQACGIAVCWRRETEPCDTCEREPA